MDATSVSLEDPGTMGFSRREAVAPSETDATALEWEETNCLLCGSDRWTVFVEGPDNLASCTGLWFAVVRCKDCGLHYTNPRPSPRSIARFYPASYFAKRAPGPASGGRQRLRLHKVLTWPRKERKVLPLQGSGRLLDFGCGGGSYLDRMSRQGWKVTGLDVAAAPIERIRSELGLKAHIGTLPHPELKPNAFDVITMWHSLEHVHDPARILRHAYFHLVPGGKILVAVPNIASLPFRWFGSSWYGLDLPRHLTHFTPQTLRWMLERAGYRVSRVRMVRQTAWLRWSARLAADAGHARRWHRCLVSKGASRLAGWYSCLTGQSDCMMVTAHRPD